MWCIFLDGFQCSPIDDSLATSCDFGVLTREEKHTSFYSALSIILLKQLLCLWVWDNFFSGLQVHLSMVVQLVAILLFSQEDR